MFIIRMTNGVQLIDPRYACALGKFTFTAEVDKTRATQYATREAAKKAVDRLPREITDKYRRITIVEC